MLVSNGESKRNNEMMYDKSASLAFAFQPCKEDLTQLCSCMTQVAEFVHYFFDDMRCSHTH